MKPQYDRTLPELVTALIQERGFDCDLNDIDVSDIRDFTGVFNVSHNGQFVGDISKWDTSSATTMTRMFEMSDFNGDISNWNTSKVTDMERMFRQSRFTGDLSKWDTSAVTKMDHMFEFTRINCDLSKWNVSKVKSMFRMFVGAHFNGDIADWDVSQCESLGQMFLAAKFTGDISKWTLPSTAQIPSVMEDGQLASFEHPNFYHWYVLTSRRGKDIAGLPPAWTEHAFSTRAIGLDMGMPDHEIWPWAQRTWREKEGLGLVLPEELDAIMESR